MAEIFSLDNLFTLAMLVMLQAVLGFDNLLYISIESKRVEESRQKFVRQSGIIGAVALRIVLLFIIINAIEYFQEPLFSINWTGVVEGTVNGHSLIVLIGGAFLIYTAMKEINHMLAVDGIDNIGNGGKRSVATAITWIIAMNLVFSFDSILSAIALTDVFWVMAVAIIISGVLMLMLADHVSEFLKKNRMYEVLGLFILFIVGIMLVSDGGHLAEIALFGFKVMPMAKSTFYFVLIILIIVEIVQSRYQKKLLARKKHEINSPDISAE